MSFFFFNYYYNLFNLVIFPILEGITVKLLLNKFLKKILNK